MRSTTASVPRADGGIGPDQLVLIIRWATLSATAVLGTPELLGRSATAGLGIAGLFIYTVFRSVRPISGRARAPLAAILEAGAVCVLMVSTGHFDSPFSFALVPPITVVAFVSGTTTSIRLAVACSVALGLPTLAGSDFARADQRTVTEWAMLYILVALVASYARRVLTDGEARVAEANQRVNRLDDANHLLFSLHTISQDLPSSMDLTEVLDTTLESIQGLVPMTFAAIVLETEAGTDWEIVAREGPEPDDSAALAIEDLRTTLVTCAVAPYQRGSVSIFPGMRDSRCVALRTRGIAIGALVLEHATPSIYEKQHEETLLLVAESASLAIDNARIFGRLRTLATHEERARIARELHDRMGQSLAYLGFELDRIGRSADHPASQELGDLRAFVGDMTTEMRHTLADLRTDIGTVDDAEAVLHEFSARVEARSSMTVHVEIDPDLDLAPLRVRELWRITQEAVLNAERHSGASRVSVTWRRRGAEVVAEVRDNGMGFQTSPGGSGRGHYGLIGMRERAASIGASISIDSPPASSGTRIRVTVPTNRPEPAGMATR